MFRCYLTDVQKPEIIEGPESQSVSIGSNATFSCTARGFPRPTIHWIKDNASYPLQSNSRASVIQDNRPNCSSQLFITRVNMEDYGKYQCIANNSFGKSQPGVAFLKKGQILQLRCNTVNKTHDFGYGLKRKISLNNNGYTTSLLELKTCFAFNRVLSLFFFWTIKEKTRPEDYVTRLKSDDYVTYWIAWRVSLVLKSLLSRYFLIKEKNWGF